MSKAIGDQPAPDLSWLFAPPPPKPPTATDEAVALMRRVEAENEAMKTALATCIVNLRQWAEGKPEQVEREYFGKLADICDDAMPKGGAA